MYRIVGDYRLLNFSIALLGFPLPHIDTFYPRVQGKKFFTKLDFKSAFYSLPLAKDCWKFTAISVSTKGQFCLRKCAMGLKNAAASFQRFVTIAFEGFEDFILNYIDDCIIFSNSMEEHYRHIQLTLERMIKFGLVLNLDKCLFFKKELVFLGVQLSSKGITPLLERVEAIKNFPLPL